MIKSILSDLKGRMKSMSLNKKRIERPDEIVHIFENILKFNNQNQEGQILKILNLD